MNNRPIAELLAEYTAERCDFTNMDWVVSVSRQYVQTMPDSQVRCLLHVLAEHVKSQSHQLLIEHFNEVCETRDRFVRQTVALRKELAALRGEPDPYGTEPQDNRRIVDYITWDTTIREMYPQQSRSLTQDGSMVEVHACTGPTHYLEPDEVGFWNISGNVGCIY